MMTRWSQSDNSDLPSGNVSAGFALPILLYTVALFIIILLGRFAEYFESDLFFLANDRPGDVDNFCFLSPLIGNHYFGDFQSVTCQANLDSPYRAEVSGEQAPLYYAFFRLLTFLPIRIGLLITLVVSLILPVATVLYFWRKRSEVSLGLGLSLLSLPTLQAIDRGNFFWIAIPSLAFLAFSTHAWKSVASLAALLTLKPQVFPLIFLEPAQGRTRVKWLLVALPLTAISNFVVLPVVYKLRWEEIEYWFVRTRNKTGFGDTEGRGFLGPQLVSRLGQRFSPDLGTLLVAGLVFLAVVVVIRNLQSRTAGALVRSIFVVCSVWFTLSLISPRYGSSIVMSVCLVLLVRAKGSREKFGIYVVTAGILSNLLSLTWVTGGLESLAFGLSMAFTSAWVFWLALVTNKGSYLQGRLGDR